MIDEPAEQDLMAASTKTSTPAGRGNGPCAAKLDEMIETAIVDAYGESEQVLGSGADWIAALRRWARGGR